MKTLLIQPPHYYDGGSRPPTFFPLGLGYVARALLDAGLEVGVLDIWAHQWTNEEVVQQIRHLDCDIIGISALSTQYAYVKWLAAELKKHTGVKIVVGGALATFSPEIVLKHTSADICVIGEGEITFRETIENWDNLSRVNGIFFKQDGEIVRNQPRQYIRDLNSIPFPAWDLFPIEIYLKNCTMFGYPHIQVMNVISSRGCPWNCRFCSKTFKKVRLRSIDNVIAEVLELRQRYNISGITFNDELVLVNKLRIYEFCDKIEPLHIKWDCQGRVNKVDLDLLKRMKKTGCLTVGFGVESGSQAILNAMNKKITVAQSLEALKHTVKAGIAPVVQMMYGYPGETEETVKETVDFFGEAAYLGPKVLRTIRLNPTVALPGAELYQQSIIDGLITDEDAYLDKLSAGYMPDVTKLLINFTKFSEDEFWQLKSKTEQQIVAVQARKHRIRFLMDTVLLKLSQVYSHYRRFGFKKTVGRIIVRLLRPHKVTN